MRRQQQQVCVRPASLSQKQAIATGSLHVRKKRTVRRWPSLKTACISQVATWHRTISQSPRCGSFQVEVMVGVVLLFAAIGFLAKISSLNRQHQRNQQLRFLALVEVENVLQQASVLPIGPISQDAVEQLTLSEVAQSRLPNAELQVTVDDVEVAAPGKPAEQHIRAIVSWGDSPRQSVELADWRFFAATKETP